MREPISLKRAFLGLVVCQFVLSSGAYAATMTFEPGAGTIDVTNQTWTEAGVTAQATWLTSNAPDNFTHLFVTGGGVGPSVGYFSGGSHVTSNAVTYFTVPGSTFDLTSFDFMGGGITRLRGYTASGTPPFVEIQLTGLFHHYTSSELSLFVGLYALEFCSFCYTTEGNGNSIDNLSFENIRAIDAGTTPLPGALLLMGTVLAGAACVGGSRRKQKAATALAAA